MALVWFDGFDQYGTAGTDLDDIDGFPYFGANSRSELATNTQLGGIAIAANSGFSSDSGFVYAFPSSYSSGRLGVGFHLYIDSDNGDDRGVVFQNGNTNSFGFYCDNNSVYLRDDAGNSTPAGSLSNNTLVHVEMVLDLDSAPNGSFEVRFNGQTIGQLTGIETNANPITRLGFGRHLNGNSGWPMYIDNLFIWDDTGSEVNDWLGEQNVITLFPSADTAQADWTLSSGSDGYDLIDNVPSDPDNNYLSSGTIGDESTFELEDLVDLGIAVTAVGVKAEAFKDGTDASTINLGATVSGSTDYSSNLSLTQDTPRQIQYISHTSPDTGVAYTPTEINSLQFAIRRAT